jgi:predicted AAA+ superfamily ATPase
MNSTNRKPLLVQGVKQVGKTFSVFQADKELFKKITFLLLYCAGSLADE